MLKLTLFFSFIFIAQQALAAGSMRIDVEVYNGPLSKSLEVQKAELIGTINLTEHILKNITRSIHISECRLGCFGSNDKFNSELSGSTMQQCSPQNSESSKLFELESKIYPDSVKRLLAEVFPKKYHNSFKLFTIGSLGDTLKFVPFAHHDFVTIPTKNEDKIHQVCPQLFNVKLNIIDVLKYIYNIIDEVEKKEEAKILHCRSTLLSEQPDSNGISEGIQTCLTRIANVGKLLTEGAEHWATTQVAVLSNSKRARIVIARAAVTAAELGNELIARTDAIVRQQKGENVADLMPTNMYLRDSEGTDYLNLFEWLDATPRKDKHWSTQSRTRMIERLIADNNWSKINTAFAQGDGKVNMVFAKDGIGNWNLKNYDNDPSEMLDAYKKIGINLFTSAAKLATKMTKPKDVLKNIAGVQQSAQQGQNMLFGSSASGVSGVSNDVINNMEKRTRERISSTYLQYENKIQATSKSIETMQTSLREKEQALEQAAEQNQEIQNQITTKKNSISAQKYEVDKTQKDFTEIERQVNLDNGDTDQNRKFFVDRHQQLEEQKDSYTAMQSELEQYKKVHRQAIDSHQEKLAQVEKIKNDINVQQQRLVQLPEQATLVIEEIIDSYQSSIYSLQSSMVSID